MSASSHHSHFSNHPSQLHSHDHTSEPYQTSLEQHDKDDTVSQRSFRNHEPLDKSESSDDNLEHPDWTANEDLSALLNKISSTSSKGSDISRPDKFSGQDRTKFRTFKTQCRMVFRAHPQKFASDERKVNYACSYLTGLAFSWYENILDLETEPFWATSWEAFIEELEKNFGDVNVQASAERNIRLLHMSPSTQVVDYITRFNTLANCLTWNDAAKTSAFRRGLAPHIKDELARLNTTYSFSLMDLQQTALHIDYRHWEREAERFNDEAELIHFDGLDIEDPNVLEENNSAYVPSTAYPIPIKPAPEHPTNIPEAEPERSRTRSLAPSPSPGPPSHFDNLPQHLAPVLLDAAGKLTEEERSRRRCEGLCMYCGQSGHIVAICPKRSTPSSALKAVTFSLQR